MDNVTHTLFGVTLARTPLRRAGRGATVALVLASNAPDIDIVTTFGGAASYLKWHRGPTHGPLGIVTLGLVTAALVWVGFRAWTFFQGRRQKGIGQEGPSEDGVRFGALAGVSILGVLFHVLMDLPTSYGTRILSPFDWHWYAADIMPIIDIYLWAILGACLLFGREATTRNAAIALVLMALNYGIRTASHHQAMAAAPRVFGPTLPQRCADAARQGPVLDRWPPHGGRSESQGPALSPSTNARGSLSEVEGSERSESKGCLIEVAAMPSFTSPFNWRLVAQLSNAYETRDVSVIDPRLRRLAHHYPNVWTAPVAVAATTPIAQIFLGFSRFPQVRAVTDRQNVTTVRWEDMRFTDRPPGPLRRGSEEPPDIFTVIVRVGPGGEIIEQRLGR